MSDNAGATVDLQAVRADVDAALGALTDALLELPDGPVARAARYSLRGPGKRFRGSLLIASYHACGGTGDAAPLAATVEMLHCYSLVHDDLPCMDDDAMRRGRPTTHRAFGPAAAVVAGASLIPVALRALGRACAGLGLSPEAAAAIGAELFGAAGACGMIAGQWLDLRAEGAAALDAGALDAIHSAKTGALIAASAKVGALAAGAGDASLDALARYGAALGLAFQIVDDVLDVTATSATLGKTVGRDVALAKSTYPALLGVQGAMDRARALVRDGCAALNGAALLTPELRHLADLIITRTS